MTTRIQIGQRWKVHDWDERIRIGREPFWFVVVENGDRPGTKKCRLEVPEQYRRRHLATVNGSVFQYTHKHIKKCATLDDTEPTNA